MIDVARGTSLPDVLSRIGTLSRDLVHADDAVFEVRTPDGTRTELIDTTGPRDRPPPAGDNVLAVPLAVGDETYGRLLLTPGPTGKFTDQDVTIATALAAAAGVAVENAVLADQMGRRERWLTASHDITSALLGDHGLTATLRLIAARATVVAGGSVGGIARPRKDDRSILDFEVVEPPGPDADRLTGLSVPVGHTATGIAFSSRQPVVVSRYGEHVIKQQADHRDALPPMVADLDSAVAIPLVAGEETLGVLVVARFRDKIPFTDTEVALATSFAAHAALAVQFARAEQDRRRLAVFEDRDRIARDLHDLVIQRLFATGLGLEGVSRLITNDAVAERIAGFAQDLDKTIRDIRNSIFALQEPASTENSLRSELLRTVLDAADMLGFEPRIGFDGPLDAAVPDPVRSDLLATLREALSNVAQHAAATMATVDVSVDRAGRELTLVVRDNGVGIPDRPARHSGTANIAARAARWHGTSTIKAVPDGGTSLMWTVNLPSNPTESPR